MIHLPLFWIPGFSQFEIQGAVGILPGVIVFVAQVIALAILFTWVFNNTKGSLLLVVLFHAAVNTAGVLVVRSPFMLVVVAMLTIVAAIIVVIAFGPARLSRRPLPDA